MILLVEDDIQFGETVKDYFGNNGLSVMWAKDGESAVRFFQFANPSLVLLDVQLPDMNGFEVAAEIQKINSTIPIIFMTGTALLEEDFYYAYQTLYAKNYLEKPFKLHVALAQVKSILYPPSAKIYNMHNVFIKIDDQQLTINNKKVLLRDKDLKVFSMLLDKVNFLVDYKDILFNVWNNDSSHLKNSLDSSIHRINKILKDFPSIKLNTYYAKGYKLSIEKLY